MRCTKVRNSTSVNLGTYAETLLYRSCLLSRCCQKNSSRSLEKGLSTSWCVSHRFTRECRGIRGAGYENHLFSSSAMLRGAFHVVQHQNLRRKTDFRHLPKLSFDFIVDFGHWCRHVPRKRPRARDLDIEELPSFVTNYVFQTKPAFW